MSIHSFQENSVSASSEDSSGQTLLDPLPSLNEDCFQKGENLFIIL